MTMQPNCMLGHTPSPSLRCWASRHGLLLVGRTQMPGLNLPVMALPLVAAGDGEVIHNLLDNPP
jgi:hypothetical protein